MASAVVGVVQQQLVGWAPEGVQPHNVLCMMCPAAGGEEGTRAVHKGVCVCVVCLAAVNAMDVGRAAADKSGVEQREQRQEAAAAQQHQQQAKNG